MHFNLFPTLAAVLLVSGGVQARPTDAPLDARQLDPGQFIADFGTLTAVITGVTSGITAIPQNALAVISALPDITGGIDTIAGLLVGLSAQVPSLDPALPTDVQEQVCRSIQPAIAAESALISALNAVIVVVPAVEASIAAAVAPAQAAFVDIIGGVSARLPACEAILGGGEGGGSSSGGGGASGGLATVSSLLGELGGGSA
ncbi:hypothetical protein Micbo1qcDRAFT_207459 [Microdochium bolleyi]|uniref:Hydrophobic surface binding protein A-domain-containing protein n=1 Tax=Microdochium bolleyi TaxID=196109 RepID=A0A136ITK1_9PEZI|nr:hypothetical protein Micbo1qcDRAFT_207459 [Microdochium bolleyi]